MNKDNIHVIQYNAQKVIKEIEDLFSSQLNGIGKMDKYNPSGRRDLFWRDMEERAYYMEHVHLKPEHLKYVLEEKKAFVKWFLETYPQYNVPYDRTKRWDRANLVSIKPVRAWINPVQIARERDLLFGTNDTEIITIDNWKESLKKVRTQEELNDIKNLFISQWEVDNFVENVKKLVDGMVESIQSLTEEIKRKEKSITLWNQAVAHAKKYVYNQKFQQLFTQQSSPTAWGSAQHGSQNPEVKLHQKAGMQYSYYVAYELMKKELDKVGYEARETVIFSELKDKIGWPAENYFPKGDGSKPELVSWNPKVSPATPASSPAPEPISDTDSGYNSDTDTDTDLTSLSKDETKGKVNDMTNELQKINDEVGKIDQQNKNKSKQEIKGMLEILQFKSNQLLDNPNVSPEEITALKNQIKNLEKRLAETEATLTSLQEYFANKASDLDLLKKYFTENKIKSIKLEGDNWIITYHDKQETSFYETSKITELQEIKTFLETTNKRELSSQELFTDSSSSPSNSPNDKGKMPFMVGGAIVVGLIVVGIIGYYLVKKRKNKKK